MCIAPCNKQATTLFQRITLKLSLSCYSQLDKLQSPSYENKKITTVGKVIKITNKNKRNMSHQMRIHKKHTCKIAKKKTLKKSEKPSWRKGDKAYKQRKEHCDPSKQKKMNSWLEKCLCVKD